MAFLRRAALLGMVLAFGCGTDHSMMGGDDDGSGLLPGFDLPDPPANGLRILTPPSLGLEPGVSHELCYYPGVKLTDQINVKKALGYQLASGHHTALYSTAVAMPPGTIHDCTNTEMASWNIVVAAGSEGQPSEAPGDLVYQVDKANYLVLQIHYINTTDNPVDSQSAMDLYFADPGGSYIPSHSVAFLNTDLDLPPGPSSIDVHCVMQTDVNSWYLTPHMHNWGTNYTASLTHAGTKTMLVDHLVWDPTFMFEPPAQKFDPTTPFTLATGDQIDVHCEWNNTTGADLHFGDEMCVFYAQSIDTTGLGNIDCDAGDWGHF